MKNIKYKISVLAGVFALAASIISCDESRGFDDYSAGGSPTQALNGEWVIDISDEATGDVYVTHALHKMYDNNDSLYIRDRIGSTETFNGWWLESRLDFNLETLTFSASDETNYADGSIVTITDGKILKNAAHSPSGVITDSIYFKGTFDYDPETVLIFAGHRKTGFEEDE